MSNNSAPTSTSTPVNLRHILLPLGRDILIPYLIYYFANRFGLGLQLAFILGAAWSALTVIFSMIRNRKLDGLALFMFVVMIGSLATSLIVGDPRIMVAKESVISGVLGIIALISLITKRPAFYYLVQKFFSMNPVEWEQRWEQEAPFRSTLRLMTLVWGLGFTIEAIVRVVIAYTLPLQTAFVWSPILMYATIILLVIWTRFFVKKPNAAK